MDMNKTANSSNAVWLKKAAQTRWQDRHVPKAVTCHFGSFRPNTPPRRHPQFDVGVSATEQLSQRLKVITLVASCVQINSELARFEVLAGRSAMVGFAVAFCTELVLPHQGLFGSWGSESYSIYAATAALLTASAAVVAALNKKRLGVQFQEAVLTSLTALSRSASSITQRNVDNAVDYVFEQVFGSRFVDANLLDVDDWL